MLLICNSVFYLFFVPAAWSGVFILMRSAAMSVSICWKIAANFGLAACMRLLELCAMLSASLRRSISACVNIFLVLCAELHVCYINDVFVFVN